MKMAATNAPAIPINIKVLKSLLFQLGIFVCGFNQRQIGLLVADGVQAIAETFDFVFFDFFHVMASDKDKFIAPSMRDQVLCSQLMTL